MHSPALHPFRRHASLVAFGAVGVSALAVATSTRIAEAVACWSFQPLASSIAFVDLAQPAQIGAPVSAPPRTQEEPEAARFALLHKAASLNPQHPVNVRMQAAGAGAVPRVLWVNHRDQYAIVSAPAVAAAFRLPLGWHAVDDGERTLIFDAAGRSQVSLRLQRARGDAVLAHVAAESRRAGAEVAEEVVQLAPDLPALVLRDAADPRTAQVLVVRALRDDGLVHVARATASAEDLPHVLALVRGIVQSLAHTPAPGEP